MEKSKKTEECLVREHHQRFLWAHFVNIFLGVWLLVSHAWIGAFVGFFAFLSLSRKMVFAPWVVCFIGIWLQFEPLLLWEKSPAIYLSDTLIGCLLIALSILIPGIPGRVEERGHEIPPGWSYNPSAWIQRIPVISLAFVGWMISKYLAAYQLGYIDTIWDPAFKEGTKMVITSTLSKSFPVPDAGLGAFAYTLETLMGCKGGPARWRTMPWMVVAFAFLVVPLGIVSIALVVSQPLIVGFWCFLCLVTAAAMLIMVVLTVDEMCAVIQFLHHAKKEGLPFWRTFWLGGDVDGTRDDLRTPSFESSPFKLIATFGYGVGLNWNLLLAALVGIWLMFSPSLLNIEGFLADMNHLFGALVIVVAIISLAEVARTLRYLLIPFGLWIGLVTWLVPDTTITMDTNQCIAGILLLLFSLRKGPIKEDYGTLSSLIR